MWCGLYIVLLPKPLPCLDMTDAGMQISDSKSVDWGNLYFPSSIGTMEDPAFYRRTLPLHRRLGETRLQGHSTSYPSTTTTTYHAHESTERPHYLEPSKARAFAEPRSYHGNSADRHYAVDVPERLAYRPAESARPSLPPLRSVSASS